jgi:hypothetical protein
MRMHRIVILLTALLAIVIVTCFVTILMHDRISPDMKAEKALRVLRPRVQQFANDTGRVPRVLEELGQTEITEALRKQIERCGYDLMWLRRDDRYGVLIARSHTTTDVAKSYVAIIVARDAVSTSSAPNR